jgi:hypothetical protein
MAKKQLPDKASNRRYKQKVSQQDPLAEKKHDCLTLNDYQTVAHYFKLDLPALLNASDLSEHENELKRMEAKNYYLDFIKPAFEAADIEDNRSDEEKFSRENEHFPIEVMQHEYISLYKFYNAYHYVTIEYMIGVAVLESLIPSISDSKDNTYNAVQLQIATVLGAKIIKEIYPLLEPYYKFAAKYKLPQYIEAEKEIIYQFQGHSKEFIKFVEASIARDKTGSHRANRDDFNDEVYMETQKPNNKFEMLTTLIRNVQKEHPEYLPDSKDHFNLDKDEQDKIMKRLRADYNNWRKKTQNC